MLLLQFTGLSGSGKTTLANRVKLLLIDLGFPCEVLDGDEYRGTLCRDLGFTREDRKENNRRLGLLGLLLLKHGILVMIATINPYEEDRRALHSQSNKIFTIWLDCKVELLVRRDPKGLYRRAFLTPGQPERIQNLTGINDPYEPPLHADLVIHTDRESPEESAEKLLHFILEKIGHDTAS
ncbi:MAG TPA: adenylyl-sulfate kinase [Saprospiraceae bacterium]|nr:adenylyl-sulfate kinase [Saprospiraceae bacterium]HNT22341.1 adenylyl-sulfate kinase [Saprospiraceae bacterium]